MMKKFLILAVVSLLSACSTWNSINWGVLNPWSTHGVEQEVTESLSQEKTIPENVNKYLWQASLDKLAVLGIETETPEEGRIITAWKTPAATPSERFKVIVEIDGAELRADALTVKVYKEVHRSNSWVQSTPSKNFENEIAQRIITQAKILYRNDKD